MSVRSDKCFGLVYIGQRRLLNTTVRSEEETSTAVIPTLHTPFLRCLRMPSHQQRLVRV
jgi:hypothetical protein